jgi:hypothetical protein
MKEKTIKEAILQKAKSFGPDLLIWSNPVSAFGASGMPDILGCYKGKAIFIELKSSEKIKGPNLGRTALQLKKAEQIMAAGGHYLCTADINEFVFFMKGFVE